MRIQHTSQGKEEARQFYALWKQELWETLLYILGYQICIFLSTYNSLYFFKHLCDAPIMCKNVCVLLNTFGSKFGTISNLQAVN